MLGVKSFDPCREFGCFQSLFFIVVDHCVPFTLAVVKSQVVLQSPFVERFMYTVKLYTSLGTKYKLGTPRVDIREDGRR